VDENTSLQKNKKSKKNGYSSDEGGFNWKNLVRRLEGKNRRGGVHLAKIRKSPFPDKTLSKNSTKNGGREEGKRCRGVGEEDSTNKNGGGLEVRADCN